VNECIFNNDNANDERLLRVVDGRSFQPKGTDQFLSATIGNSPETKNSAQGGVYFVTLSNVD
jgi:hypothetical protein